MIISIEKAKKLVDLTAWPDDRIEMKLNAIEQTIRSYTNNNFQNRSIRAKCSIVSQKIYGHVPGLNVGDTIMVTESRFNNGLYVVNGMDDDMIILDKDLLDEADVLVTKVEYPADVVDCCINLLEWEKNNRSKVGIQSETLSRHSVTYFNQDAGNQVMGYPVSLLGCLKAYRKVRF